MNNERLIEANVRRRKNNNENFRCQTLRRETFKQIFENLLLLIRAERKKLIRLI